MEPRNKEAREDCISGPSWLVLFVSFAANPDVLGAVNYTRSQGWILPGSAKNRMIFVIKYADANHLWGKSDTMRPGFSSSANAPM